MRGKRGVFDGHFLGLKNTPRSLDLFLSGGTIWGSSDLAGSISPSHGAGILCVRARKTILQGGESTHEQDHPISLVRRQRGSSGGFLSFDLSEWPQAG